MDTNIALHHVTRVEGHGNIYVNVKEKIIEKCEWNISEAPRFFESMVVGRRWNEIHHITSRICGICSIGHTLTSLKATEAAIGLTVNKQDLMLRKLALHAENIQSHILHLGYLVLPDLLGAGSVIPLASSHPDQLKTVIRLHRMANEMSNLICGRTTHPQRLVPGGFSKYPTLEEVRTLGNRLKDALSDAEKIADLFMQLADGFPDFERETEFIALTTPDEYAMYDGKIGSTLTESAEATEYLSFTNEYIVPTSTAKRAKHARDSYMVGALARLNINYDKLSPIAKKTANLLGLKPVCHNPFMNNFAQLVEVMHCMEDSIRLTNELESVGFNPHLESPVSEIKVKAGRGIGAIEVPRGILFHDYTYNDKGICTKANFVIPTNQNHGNIELDMKAILPQILDKPRKDIDLTLEMLVRAYDPCISCSTHSIKVHYT